MSKISKGTRVFGIYFIVYACEMFLWRVGSILYHVIESITLASRSASRFNPWVSPEVISYTQFDAVVDFIGVGLAIFAFFAALRILKSSRLALQSVLVIGILGIGYNILAIAKDAMKIVNSPEAVRWSAYNIAGGIACSLLSIGFWSFVLYFFNRSSIKEQFASA